MLINKENNGCLQNCEVIVVNATATRAGGALTILNQFIANIPNDDFKYVIFVDVSYQRTVKKKNVQIIPVEKRSFVKRFLWDVFELKKYLKNHSIEPVIAISLQNTNFRLNKPCPNYIYYHQPLPFFPYKWKFFKSKERSFWFYKNIYPFFVNLFVNKKTEFFVQLDFIKDAFVKRFCFSKDKVHVIFPEIESPKPEPIDDLLVDDAMVKFFYPATPLIYKNHRLLFESLTKIDDKLLQKIVLYLTCERADFKELTDFKNIQIVFIGTVKHANVMWLYEQADALLFPSYIETLGLPLIEAAGLGLPILAADLPYAREVLDGYSGVIFIDHQDAERWGKKILQLSRETKIRYSNYEIKNKKGWNDFFEIIKRNI